MWSWVWLYPDGFACAAAQLERGHLLTPIHTRPTTQKLVSWARAQQDGRAVSPNVMRDLAQAIAAETGDDPRDIAARLEAE